MRFSGSGWKGNPDIVKRMSVGPEIGLREGNPNISNSLSKAVRIASSYPE